jgi:hypothetical protein
MDWDSPHLALRASPAKAGPETRRQCPEAEGRATARGLDGVAPVRHAPTGAQGTTKNTIDDDD